MGRVQRLLQQYDDLAVVTSHEPAHEPRRSLRRKSPLVCKTFPKPRGNSFGYRYFYQSLPFCVIDAVFSLGVRYRQVQNVVNNAAQEFGGKIFRELRGAFPPPAEQMSIDELIREISKRRDPEITLYKNLGYVNPRAKKRVLKAEVVRQFSQVLHDFSINTFQDLDRVRRQAAHRSSTDLDEALRRLPGLSSGVAVSYFYMLAGDEGTIKPDRMIHRFIVRVVGTDVDDYTASNIIKRAALDLKDEFSHLTPRSLDYAIWDYERKTCC
jgi:hypothetical protein